MVTTQLRQRILLVDDDPDFVQQATTILSTLAEVRSAGDIADALDINLDWRPDLVLLDALFGVGDSFAVLDALRQARSQEHFSIVYLTKGRGASNHVEPFGDEVFGMIPRDRSGQDFQRHMEHAVQLTSRMRLAAS